ncbi:RNA-metabolising metallo-beta-lactamase and metallo-beta-lactamase superfamily domain containing protein, putative [Babesia bigemina]|uniref:RNA-metabolising metallo-beta-lactamase and metallo-beta-lactamase superfamily domain containing protein, putative n=1 Tax=Babesia bigemina TaxID=5866 RepID=A0A061D6E3_BABBI|nr:RNA-metabolising metallo-beta-lactamase and metallo-beta-lactamase superfamily domain containing protein, putative [Babesia bigemina]CDR95587.1 RNA-metabolising metallo-beta-lactamase and metallo-beta-lactamase superfamily domain containing protein, putative [Babesia bigemina]|eukprot:XP_012767773.1 RNA-metabolising metallo-beta-lactamase and metallo-beta-lactamase superfamily domain containing protein, putative [Babesia bigemina]
MSSVDITILGAGQDVGRSCIVVTFPSRRVLFDCGAHCGFVDHRRYPDLQLLGDPNEYNALYNEQMNAEFDSSASDGDSNSDTATGDGGATTSNTADSRGQLGAKTSASNVKDKTVRIATCMKNALQKTLINVTEHIDICIISHFHLDHVGALPFLTEHLGYNGPVYMTYPTRGLAPILLRDSAQVVASKFRNTVDTEGVSHGLNVLLNRTKKRKSLTVGQLGKVDPWGYTVDCVAQSLGRAQVMQLRATQEIGNVSITPYYAGHVLGAAMFHVECDGISVVYTGDFNTSPDKHLGPAYIPQLKPDVLICESTYASVVRQPRRATEMELCTVVHDCLIGGGKVLIPVFAVGRAQELAIILDNYWTKLQLTFPIYFGGGLSERATSYYKLHSAWTDSQNIPNLSENPFAMKHMLPFDNSFLNDDRPMVLFATPGMVHSGLSLKVCKLWGPNPKNLIVIPGYAAQGTVGNKLISGEKLIHSTIGTIEIKCKVRYLSFSAHADSVGIMRLIKQVQPKHLVLVHGEYDGMKKFAKHIALDFGIPVFHPANGQTITIKQAKGGAKMPIFYYPQLLLEASGIVLTAKDEIGHSKHPANAIGSKPTSELNDSRGAKDYDYFAASDSDSSIDFCIKKLEEPADHVSAIMFRLEDGIKSLSLHSNNADAAGEDKPTDAVKEEASGETPGSPKTSPKLEQLKETKGREQLLMVSRNHMAKMFRDGVTHLSMMPELRCHRVKYRQSFKCRERDFVEATEYVARVLNGDKGYFVEELPIYAKTMESGVLRVGGLEARHNPEDDMATMEWYYHEMQPNSIVYTMVHFLEKVAKEQME